MAVGFYDSLVMQISIGILAWNEEAAIGATLQSLFEQTLLSASFPDIASIQVVVVANGCTDSTVHVAQRSLTELRKRSSATVTSDTCVLEEPSKSNAWNYFVHTASDSAADYIFLVDADVAFADKLVLERLLRALQSDSEAVIAAGKLLKVQVGRGRVGHLDRLSLAVSRYSHATVRGLAGGLYCARGSDLRRIWMPKGLLVEDGYLKAMVVTDRFTAPVRPSRLIRVDEAQAFYVPSRRLIDVYKHSRRLMIGTAINSILFTFLWHRSKTDDVGNFVDQMCRHNPDWLIQLVNSHVRRCGWCAIQGRVVFGRLLALRTLPFGSGLRKLPIAVLAAVFDFAVFVSANRKLKRLELRW